ncbi:Localized to the inner membrane of the chloroplast [Gossypium australe]|uniref:Localized to the inner membrane of the chloroplast n=1 Tax=Gossypium australe TaxID=47621 RepID=A0A5B6WUD2_9ROSI|nr:Localized to the inner membrane of the chloroplast [Gossypium australe]
MRKKKLKEYDPSSFSAVQIFYNKNLGSHLKTAGGASPTNLSFNSNGLGKLHLSSSRRPVSHLDWIWRDDTPKTIQIYGKNLENFEYTHVEHIHWESFSSCVLSDGERPSSASIFVGGFILGGLVVGALGCVFAPQISKAVAGADRKDLMKRLPKFIYDEEKALEKTRKILTEKIAQLNSAIDDVSAQLRSEDAPNGVAVNSDEIETAI